MRVALAQINTVVGDIQGNTRRVIAAVSAAQEQGAGLTLLPELAITGYPPEDLLHKDHFVEENLDALEMVSAACGQMALVGFVDKIGGSLYIRKLPENAVPWLYRAVRNLALSSSRAASRRKRREAQFAQSAPAWFMPPEDDGLDADAAAAALRTLPVEQREAIVAHIWGALTFDEIGQVTGSSSSTAHRHYVEGLCALRERLGVHVQRKVE